MNEIIKPSHYNKGGIECIEAIKASMTAEEFRGFLKGNVMKYLWRFENKGGQVDLEKAEQYLMWLKANFKPNTGNLTQYEQLYKKGWLNDAERLKNDSGYGS